MGDFIGMVDIDMVGAAAVDIELIAQKFHAHGRTFDMPARKPDPPGRVPLHLAPHIFGRKLPQGKIGGIAFFRVFLHPRAFLQGLDILMGKLGVVGKLRGVEINPVTGLVGVSFFFQSSDQCNLIVDRIGGFDPDIRRKYIEPGDVFLKCPGVEFSDFPGAAAFALGAFFHFVFAHVPVAGQVAHIGNIHDMLNPVSVVQQDPLQNIFKNIGAQVADVGIVINGRPAGVKPDLPFAQRDEFFFSVDSANCISKVS